ncbi:hypothetical protein B4N89_45520 [Embleya scabrispora]|uniref:Uncharacterized protein n=1 Tax=Embleya scabrispora TaxID=159449 RepID=A0A1T3NIT4_9ACTN|nr:hypothetical protein [Embleya scabrispora]OPC76746.1 hypothetical protein B4N89_45520 [Embleya scabrispora]
MDEYTQHTPYAPPRIGDVESLLARAEADSTGSNSDDASSGGRYNKNADDDLWGAPLLSAVRGLFASRRRA